MAAIRERSAVRVALAAILIHGAWAGSAAAQNLVQGWHSDLDSAVAAVRQSGLPLFLVFRCVR